MIIKKTDSHIIINLLFFKLSFKLKEFKALKQLKREVLKESFCTITQDSFPISLKSLKNLKVGRYSYGPIKFLFLGEEDSNKLTIGQFCSIAKNTTFLCGGEHCYKTLSTYAINPYITSESPDPRNFKDHTIFIGDDVWIGLNALIVGPVKIGQGAVIGAGAIITKDVEPYSIVVGHDRFVKYRFSEQVRKELLSFADYSKFNINLAKEYGKFLLDTPLNEDNINQFRRFFKD